MNACYSPIIPPSPDKILLAITFVVCAYWGFSQSLIITSVFDGPLAGGRPKGIELFSLSAIPDLSMYGIGSANNGGGSDGEEFTFPADSLARGTYFYIASDSTEFHNFFGIPPTYVASAVNVNGDDAIELFQNGVVIDLFGDIHTDGTGEAWEYTDGWFSRNYRSHPSSSFNITQWNSTGTNALDGEVSNASAQSPIPLQSFAAVYNGVVWLGTTDLFGNQSNLAAPSGILNKGIYIQSGQWNLTAEVTATNLFIDSSASVLVSPNRILAIDSLLSNAGSMSLLADSSGYAQILIGTVGQLGTYEGNSLTVEQYIEDDSGGSKWTHVGIPINGDLSKLSFDPSASFVYSGGSTGGQNVYHWDEPSASWLAPGSSNFIPETRGLALYLGSGNYGSFPGTLSIEGDLRTNKDSAALSFSGSDPSISGWNFVGNPFSTGIDWGVLYTTNYDAGTMPLSSIAKVYNPAAGSYSDINANALSETDRVIPLFQGFWVKMNSTPSPNPKYLAIELDHRSTQATDFRGASQGDLLVLRAQSEAFSTQSEVALELLSTGTRDYDVRDGMHKNGERWESIQFYFESEEGYPLSTNSTLDEQLPQSVWPLFFEVWMDTLTTYEIELRDDPFPIPCSLELFDRKTQVTHDLRSGSYSFQASSADSTDRFEIILTRNGLHIMQPEQQPFWVISDFHYWNIQSEVGTEITRYTVYNILGQKVLNSGKTANQIPKFGLSAGSYFVHLHNSKQRTTILKIQK